MREHTQRGDQLYTALAEDALIGTPSVREAGIAAYQVVSKWLDLAMRVPDEDWHYESEAWDAQTEEVMAVIIDFERAARRDLGTKR